MLKKKGTSNLRELELVEVGDEIGIILTVGDRSIAIGAFREVSDGTQRIYLKKHLVPQDLFLTEEDDTCLSIDRYL